MDILVLGSGCAKCHDVEQKVHEAVKVTAVVAEVKKVTDIMEMLKLGVMSTPAIIIDGVTMSTGRVPTVEEICGWLNQHRS